MVTNDGQILGRLAFIAGRAGLAFALHCVAYQEDGVTALIAT
jgi:hypothetical protein